MLCIFHDSIICPPKLMFSNFFVSAHYLYRFKAWYYPLIELMIHLRFALLSKEVGVEMDTIQNTHTLNLVLEDIPDDVKGATKPRIIVKNMSTVPFAALNEVDRLSFEETRGELMDQGFVVSYTFVYPVPEFGTVYTWKQSCLHSRDPFYYFRRYDKREMLQKIIWLTEGINGMAKGTRPDIYKEVKLFLKEDGGRHLKGNGSVNAEEKARRKKNRATRKTR